MEIESQCLCFSVVPFNNVTTTVAEALLPSVMLADDGERVNEKSKSGGGGTVTFNVYVVVLVKVPFVPVKLIT